MLRLLSAMVMTWSGRHLSCMATLRRIRLRPGDHKELKGWVRARTTPQRRAERAQIVLDSAGGLAGKADVSLPTVQR